jgi:VWFA-related protein
MEYKILGGIMKRFMPIIGFILLCMNTTPQNFQHEVTVTLRLVQVFVTDKDGNPVRGLKADDLSLFVDGNQIEITDFETHFTSSEQFEVSDDSAPRVPHEKEKKFRRKYFLIFDYMENDVSGIAFSKNAAIHFIDTQLASDDEASVLSYSASEGFVLQEYLTSDKERLKDSIKNTKRIPGFRSMDWLRGREHVINSEYFIKDMKDLSHVFRLIPGNKNILLFSRGIHYYDVIQKRMYEEMCDALADVGAKVFTINSAGLRVELSNSGFTGRRPYFNKSVKLRTPLEMLSDATGGQYYSDVVYHEIYSDHIKYITSNYYIIGFYIDETQDGKFHKIKVKANRKGLKVSTQRGYFNPKPFTQQNEIENRLHLIDLAFSDTPNSQQSRKIPVKASKYHKNDEKYVMLSTELSRVSFKEVFNGKTELVVFAGDKLNIIRELKLGTYSYSSFKEDSIVLNTNLTLPPGEYEFRLVYRNTGTGEGVAGASNLLVLKEEFQDFRINTLFK